VRVEQKPSEEVIISVKPSLDLFKQLVGTFLRQSRDLPSQIREGSTMEIANDTERCLLLSVIKKHGVLRSNGIYHTVRERERHWWARRSGTCFYF
jgi:hypothetical protein